MDATGLACHLDKNPWMDIKQKLQEAIAFHQSDQLQQAEQIYQQVLQISPRNADALNLLGFLACTNFINYVKN